MWQEFSVKNFKCFNALSLNKLSRVNLITGMNNTGKTSLLEAMLIHSYPQSCSLPFTISAFRGLMDNQFTEDIGSWLFLNRHTGLGLETISQDGKGLNRVLRVFILNATEARQRFPKADKRLQASFIEKSREESLPRIVMENDEGGHKSLAIGVASGTGISSVGNDAPWDGPAHYLGFGRSDPQRDLNGFNNLKKSKNEKRLLTYLRSLEPRLQELSILLLAGKEMIHADVGLDQYVPIPMMGEGFGRFLSALLAIDNTSSGRVLIDEIDNGLHHSVLKIVWKSIAQAARDGKSQVFATTHSYECIRAAHEAFTESGTYDLRLMRLDRQADGEITVAAYDQEVLDYALEMAHEVR